MDAGFPLVILLGPALAAILAMIIRRRRRAVIVLGLATLGLLTLLLWLAKPDGLFTDNAIALLGREIVLTSRVRSLFLLIYPAMALLFLVTWFLPSGFAIVPLGLSVLSPLAAAVMVSPAGFGAMLILAASAIVIPTLHGGRYDMASVAWRYFALMGCAMAPLLLIVSPSPDGTTVSWFVPALAALILLGGFPFHSWVGGLGRRSSYPALALTLGLVPIVVIVLLLNFLDAVPAVRSSVEFQATIRWSAALSALIAAFLAVRADDWRGLIGALLVLDTGLLLAATLAPGAGGLIIALPALIGRFLGLLLVGLGSAWPAGGGHQGSGIPARWPWLSELPPVVLLYGCLSLVGLPLTPGFAGRWSELAVIAGGSIWPVFLVVLGLTIAAARTLRLAAHAGAALQTGRALSRGGMILATILLGMSLLAGIFPDLVVNYVSRILGV